MPPCGWRSTPRCDEPATWSCPSRHNPRRWSGPRHAWRTGDHPTVAVWTAHQSAQFLHYIRQRRLYSLFRLITLVGLRRGEACALRWCDLDLQRRAVLICWQVQQHSGELSTCEAKTASSVRLIALDRLAVTALRRHYATTARSVTRLDTLARHRSGAFFTKSRALVPPSTAGLTGPPGLWNGDDDGGSESAPGTVATCSAGWATVITETMVQITRRSG